MEEDGGGIVSAVNVRNQGVKNGETKRVLNILKPALKDAKGDPQLLAIAGEAYMQARDFIKATGHFEKASEIDPNNAQLHTALSLSRMGKGEDSRAVSEREIAAKLDPQSPRAQIPAGHGPSAPQGIRQSARSVKALEKENPDNPLIQNLKGSVYLGKRDIANAYASFEKALAIQPTYLPAVVNLA